MSLGAKAAEALDWPYGQCRTALVTLPHNSPIRVYYGAQEVATDVTAAQVLMWNRGKESIRRENVLKPLHIYTEPSTPILEARLARVTRDVTSCAIDDSQLMRGVVGISCAILEAGDGLALQLIYAGKPEVEVRMDGVIEGQGSPDPVLLNGEIDKQGPKWAIRMRSWGTSWFSVVRSLISPDSPWTRPITSAFINVTLFVLLVVLGVWFWIRTRDREREQEEALEVLTKLLGQDNIPAYFTDSASEEPSSKNILWGGLAMMFILSLVVVKSIIDAFRFAPAPFDFH